MAFGAPQYSKVREGFQKDEFAAHAQDKRRRELAGKLNLSPERLESTQVLRGKAFSGDEKFRRF